MTQTGGWGHINVDQIVFCDWPGDRELLETLASVMPIRFSAIHELPAEANGLHQVLFEELELVPNGKKARAENGLQLFTRLVGKGNVAVAGERSLIRRKPNSRIERQAAYSALCEMAGANYTELEGQSAKAPGFGTLALATSAPNATALVHFEDWADAWKQFSQAGGFSTIESAASNTPTPAGKTINGAMATTISVPAGGTVQVPFVFAWHYPNSYYEQTGEWIGCHYATRWTDARAVLGNAARDHDHLRQQTELFRKTIYDSTLPYWLLDCLTANSGIMRHIGIVFKIAKGDIYGWEGSNGCCPPTCTHVWGYEQSLAHLFPDLEKEMRRVDFTHQQNADGGINNRTLVPSPPHPTGEHPFTDGHASCILKAYREALNSPDDSFFKEYWPNVKRAVEYLIHRDANDAGGQPTGSCRMTNGTPTTKRLHGVTTFISGYYLAALRAGEEWARRMGDTCAADRFHERLPQRSKQAG